MSLFVVGLVRSNPKPSESDLSPRPVNMEKSFFFIEFDGPPTNNHAKLQNTPVLDWFSALLVSAPAHAQKLIFNDSS